MKWKPRSECSGSDAPNHQNSQADDKEGTYITTFRSSWAKTRKTPNSTSDDYCRLIQEVKVIVLTQPQKWRGSMALRNHWWAIVKTTGQTKLMVDIGDNIESSAMRIRSMHNPFPQRSDSKFLSVWENGEPARGRYTLILVFVRLTSWLWRVIYYVCSVEDWDNCVTSTTMTRSLMRLGTKWNIKYSN